jgi:hypothetical protein
MWEVGRVSKLEPRGGAFVGKKCLECSLEHLTVRRWQQLQKDKSVTSGNESGSFKRKRKVGILNREPVNIP